MSLKTLRRYTQLAPLIHLLQRKSLTLLNPSGWDDKNDAFYLEVYRRKKGLGSVLALCFAESAETYHHWQVFGGTSGVCLEFEKDTLVQSVCRNSGVKCDSVQYPLITSLRKNPPAVSELPFVKRYPYRDEREFRFIYEDPLPMLQAKDIPFEPDALKKVTMNPWMPPPVFESVKAQLQRIEGWQQLQISTTTIINNDEWMRLAGGEDTRTN